MALATVEDLVTTARVLLQDRVEPYRYSTAELLVALSMGMLEARRLRPDLFRATPDETPDYDTLDDTEIEIDQQYRPALLYYVVGHAHLRDEEDTSDARASAFLQKFTAQLLTVPS
jgi:hypothetical protein